MFGIFPLTQLHPRQFWDGLSWQLQRRGPEYVRRCTFRNVPLSASDNVILPAMFPPLLYEIRDIPQAGPSDNASEEDLKDVSDITGA